MSLPLVELSGDERAQGRGHGEALRERVLENREVYLEHFEKEAGLSREDLLSRAAARLESLRPQSPSYVEGMAGIAEATGLDLLEVTALNARYEILYEGLGRRLLAEAARDGCTAFALLPEATREGRLLSGQNWDWIPELRGALVRVTGTDAPDLLGFVEAGIFAAKIGLNSEGITLNVNGMLSTEDDGARPERPFHLRCHEALRARSLAEAEQALAGTPRACAVNFLLASAAEGRALDLELAPGKARRLEPVDGRLVHANHFTDAEGLGVEEPPNPRRHFSVARQERLEELLREADPPGVVRMQHFLRDHRGDPQGICRHRDESLPRLQQTVTVTSVIMEPESGVLWATEGPPCRDDYREHRL